MTFVHQDPEFAQLVQIVARSTGIAAALIEKDYWVTHTLWAIHQTGLDIWFKGGTSLSKGFGLIQRFSEDLDLMVERGTVGGLPADHEFAAEQARKLYDLLPSSFVVSAWAPSALRDPRDPPRRTEFEHSWRRRRVPAPHDRRGGPRRRRVRAGLCGAGRDAPALANTATGERRAGRHRRERVARSRRTATHHPRTPNQKVIPIPATT